MGKVQVIDVAFRWVDPEGNELARVSVVNLILGCPACGTPAKELGNGSIIISFFNESFFFVYDERVNQVELVGTPEALVDAFYQSILLSGRRGIDAFHVCLEEGTLFRMTAGTIKEIRQLAQAFFESKRKAGASS